MSDSSSGLRVPAGAKVFCSRFLQKNAASLIHSYFDHIALIRSVDSVPSGAIHHEKTAPNRHN
jgi:hypothetical protein